MLFKLFFTRVLFGKYHVVSRLFLSLLGLLFKVFNLIRIWGYTLRLHFIMTIALLYLFSIRLYSIASLLSQV
ncbi:hypothetical protein GGR58DRAFT_479002 [Xylaria digitata]|nr:hypothetical protein GGR58DRAFT_479002 [Xylaria digitata]